MDKYCLINIYNKCMYGEQRVINNVTKVDTIKNFKMWKECEIHR